MAPLLKRLWPEEKAQGLSEYVLLLVLLALTAITTLGGVASQVDNIYSRIGTHVNASADTAPLASEAIGYAAQGPADRQAESNGKNGQKSGD